MKKRHPFWTTLGVIFLVLIIAGGVTALCGYFLGWYDNDEELLDEDIEEQDGYRQDGDEQGAVIYTYRIDPSQYSLYGIEEYADTAVSAYTLTASFEGFYIDPRISWKIEWDTSYEGTDDVQEYVLLETEDYSNVCTLVCLQPFGYNIYVTAYRTASPDVSVTCKLDFLCSVSFDVSFIDTTFTMYPYLYWWDFDDKYLSTKFFIDVQYGVGTYYDVVTSFSCDGNLYCSYSVLCDMYPSLAGKFDYYALDIDNDIYSVFGNLGFSGYYLSTSVSSLDFPEFSEQSIYRDVPVTSSYQMLTVDLLDTDHCDDFLFFIISLKYFDDIYYFPVNYSIAVTDSYASLSLDCDSLIFS